MLPLGSPYEKFPSIGFLPILSEQFGDLDVNNAAIGPRKLLYMAVRDFGDLRAQNQPKVCPNFGDLRVQGRKICPRLVRFWGYETDLGCFGPGPWTQNKSKINVNYGVLPGPTLDTIPQILNNGLQITSRLHGRSSRFRAPVSSLKILIAS